jgi:alkylresorcinol/alkylpyrone synthase
MKNIRLASLETAVPPHILETAHVVKQAKRIFARFGDEFERMLPVFINTGIDRRYSACPDEWFDQNNDWPERTKQFTSCATSLFKEASSKAIAAAGIEAKQVDAIITISSTGIATPTIEARAMHEMGFRDDVMRVPVFGLGCAGGVTGLSLASRMATGMPGKTILLCVIELCTLAFRPDEMTKSNVIATALFGDGAAAAIIRDTGEGPIIEYTGEHTWPGTLDVMGWRVDPDGFGAIFSRSIPDLALNDLRPAADGFLNRNEKTFRDVDHYSFHPGGTKVIQALETAFELAEGQLQNERKILAGYGNMSAPTVLFVLKEALAQPWSGRRFIGSLGPGFTASFMTMVQA